MAKLVQKSGYIKSGKASGYMRYIATREGVEKLAGNSAVTKGQRELIQKLLHDFPDAVELFEYEDYCKTPTLGMASAFITMALDANLHEMNSECGPSSTLCAVRMLIVWNTTTPMRGVLSSWRTHRRWRSQ